MTLQQPTDTLDIQALLPAGTPLIGGDWVPARAGDTIPVINPATGETLAAVARGGPDDVAAAVSSAEDVFERGYFVRTVSAESILDYTQVKSVIIDGRA